MRLLERTRPRRRLASYKLIKLHRNYTIEETARLVGTVRGTVRRWIKSGALPAITDQRPNLILGGDLRDYLQARSKSRIKLALHECYCLKCRAGRSPALGMIEYVPQTATTGNLKALCENCTTVMHKAISKNSLELLGRTLDLTIRPARQPLIDMRDPTLNDHLSLEARTHA